MIDPSYCVFKQIFFWKSRNLLFFKTRFDRDWAKNSHRAINHATFRFFGFLDFWFFGLLVFWSFGFLVFWSFGFLDFWFFGQATLKLTLTPHRWSCWAETLDLKDPDLCSPFCLKTRKLILTPSGRKFKNRVWKWFLRGLKWFSGFVWNEQKCSRCQGEHIWKQWTYLISSVLEVFRPLLKRIFTKI